VFLVLLGGILRGVSPRVLSGLGPLLGGPVSESLSTFLPGRFVRPERLVFNVLRCSAQGLGVQEGES